uniref:extracellular signal-regulated kinase 2-like isoform X2 n=1 Tax=Ciona intestinalis TaxID=7719 RepID=UPI000EF4608A|nr:extracellular signal-regulated kinase 2-like isoform X2 [Ciona intestinalis]|eukprot:XP_026690740.1 extracellular signal-regulated kinase 2-like isoform X2 [Ciona intestinalis]
MSNDIDPHITEKYEIKRRLGKGAYGIVWKALDRRTGEIVALKKIFDAFRNCTDAQRTFREIMFLQEFGDHSNVIKLLNVMKADNDRDIYLVFEFMDTDLHAVIKKGNILKDIHKRYIMYQLLKATMYMHSGNVIHRDHKPSNILLDSDCFVKICDFGLARSLTQLKESEQPGGNPALTEYVATRWYRAPEILLASPRYTKGVDMWSVGCILGELLMGKPLFPGSSTLNQIERIMSSIPRPTKADVDSIHSEYGHSILDRASMRPRKHLRDLIPDAPEDALDLMENLLVFNPEKRLSAKECLSHPYVAKFHSSREESVLDYDVLPPLDDDIQLSVAEYRCKLYEMILERKTMARRQRRAVLHEKQQQNKQKNSDEIIEEVTKQKRVETPPPAEPRNVSHPSKPGLVHNMAHNYENQHTTHHNGYQPQPQPQRHHYQVTAAGDKPHLGYHSNGSTPEKKYQMNGSHQKGQYGVAFGRTVKMGSPQQTNQRKAYRAQSAGKPVQRQDSFDGNREAMRHQRVTQGANKSTLQRHHSMGGPSLKHRQQSAPSQPVNGTRSRSLRQQFNADHGHKLLTRQDNPTINVSRMNPVQRPSSAIAGQSSGMQATTPPRAGRKQVSGMNKNISSSGSPKQRLGSYAQSYSVINQSALTAIGAGGRK